MFVRMKTVLQKIKPQKGVKMLIETLKSNQVFVFGSNSTGFHGEGAAGFAMRGKKAIRNTPDYVNWRDDGAFLAAKAAPIGSSLKKGMWAIYGVPRAFQKGNEGMSYAIETILHPGKKWYKSVSRREIYYQLVSLWEFAETHQEFEFLMTPVGAGYSGWSRKEMNEVLWELISRKGLPENIKNTTHLYGFFFV